MSRDLVAVGLRLPREPWETAREGAEGAGATGSALVAVLIERHLAADELDRSETLNAAALEAARRLTDRTKGRPTT